MGDLIKFRPKTAHLNRESRPALSEDYAARLIRIKEALMRINELLNDTKHKIVETLGNPKQ